MTPEQLAASGVTARRLLEWAWATERRDKGLVVHAIQCVARSYASDVTASGGLLRRSIEPEHLAQFGADEAFHLANELKHILPHDPEFVRDVYSALFSFRETSNATSPMGSSRILSMTSTRRQDYDMAQYMLGELFERFLECSPEHATEAAIAVAEGYVRHEHDRDTGRKVVLEQFSFLGHEATLEHDGSCIWDASSVHEKDAGLKIVGSVGPHIAELAATVPDVARRCLELIALNGRMAIIWRRLLEAGAEAPDTLGLMIHELAQATPLLTCLDTCTEAGAFLTAVFPLLAEAERTRVEETILAIPDGKAEDALKWASHRRDILLGCLPRDLLTTEATRTRLAELDAVGSVPENAPAFRMEVGWGGEVTTDDWLEREGVDVKAPAHRALLDLGEGLKGLPLTQADLDDNSAASSDVTTKMQSMLDALHEGENASVDPEVLKAGWGSLAETALRVAQLNVTCEKEIGVLTRAVLLEAGTRPPRRAEPAVDSQFDEHPGWSTPAPRVTGADGLILLARHSDCVGPDLLESIERLSRDSDPAVRLQISTRLWLLNETAPELLWTIAGRMVESDPSAAVLQALIGHSICRIWRRDPPRAVRMTTDLLGRFREGPGVNHLRDSCLQLIAGLHVWQEVPEATQALDELLGVRPVDLADAAHLCTELRAALLTDKGPKKDEPDGTHVRARAIELVRRLLEPATQELMGIRGDTRPADKWSPEETERLKSLLQFADLVARELYYATGVFEERTKGDDAKVPTPSQRKRFFEEAKPLLEMIADLGIPSATHHLLEMLEHYIEHAPREAFLLIVRALRAGEWGGYQYESMGQDLFVRLVERYLAEHRSLFQDDQECQSGMLAVLDIFVRAGWPSAQRLSYRLDEIFR